MALRIVFFGTAELACASLRALAADSQFSVVAVVTQPDKPRGRDLQVQPSAVKIAALALNLPVLQPGKARDPIFIDQVRGLNPDLGVVVAYGQILPQALLDVPKRGFVNVHTSLLPRHRGAAPIQTAILMGDAETGVTIMKMDAGLDTGPILTQRATPISKEETSQSLHDRLARMGAELLVQTLPRFARGEIPPHLQPEGATYAAKIEKTHGLIQWSEPAAIIERKIRAFTPWPGAHAYFEIGNQSRLLKIWKATVEEASGPPGKILPHDRQLIVACGEQALRLLEIQMEGRKRMSAQDFLAGQTVARTASNPV